MNTVFEKDIDLSIFEPYKMNCSKCCGLCCVALYCTKSDGFPKDKEMGVACENLLEDYKCKVHSKLLQQKLGGCLAYDCFGAGQFISHRLKSLPNWNTIPKKEADRVIQAFLVVLQVHQTLWYLSQCIILRLKQSEKEQAKALMNEGHILIEQPFEKLVDLNTQSFCKKSNDFLKYVCNTHQKVLNKSDNTPPLDYMGQNMKRKNLAGKDFSRSLLIAANLEQAKVYGANFLGADMRDTNICNTDLSQSLFLTQMQINAAKGNHNTMLPSFLQRPKVWDWN